MRNGHVTMKTFLTVVITLMIAFSGWIFNVMDKISNLNSRTSGIESDISWIRERLEDIQSNPTAKRMLRSYMEANVVNKDN